VQPAFSLGYFFLGLKFLATVRPPPSMPSRITPLVFMHLLSVA
jgi:hypothetical protein